MAVGAGAFPAASGRVARIALGVVSGIVLLAAATIDLPRLSDGRFWSDAASYHAMAGSLAFDADLVFGPEDLARVRASYPGGPQGVVLKRTGDAGRTRLVYAKAFAYPAVATPLVRLLGVDRGLLGLNGLLLVLSLWLFHGELRRASGEGTAAAGALALLVGGAAPVYLFWETPEIFNLALATAGLVAWRRGRPLAAAALLGLLAYSKPTNLALALPLLLDPLLAGRAWSARVLEFLRRGAAVALVVAGLFALNRLATGEANYQGGERKTFYDRYPFDPGATFESVGVWMTTDHLGPLVAGRDDDEPTGRVAPPRAAAELRLSFLQNLGYFWVGRFGGVLPYFPGVAAALLLFLLVGPRARDGWLALAALVTSWLGYLLMIPDNWYGGAGTIGNRYFVNLVPLGLLLLPRGRGAWAAAGAAFVSGALLLPVLASPVRHSLFPGEHTVSRAFRVLPAELTMLGDLSVFVDVWRKRRPYNAPGGDPGRRLPGTPPSYFLWFLDDSTFGQESSFDAEGFWLRGGQSGEVVLQALAPPARVRLKVTSGPAGDIVTARIGRVRQRLVLPPLKTQEIVFEAPPAALGYYGTSLYLVRLGSRYGGPTGDDRRNLGSFVVVELDSGRSGARETSRHPAVADLQRSSPVLKPSFAFAMMLVPAVVLAAPADKPGCADHPLFPVRMPDYRITDCRVRDYDSVTFLKMKAPARTEEGRATWLLYQRPPNKGAAALEIVKNYENALARIGAKIADVDPRHFVLGKVVQDGREVWAQAEAGPGGNIRIQIVEKTTMAQHVVADAKALGNDLEARGHAAVDGIYFDTAKAVLKPESAAALQQVAKLLAADPALRLWVVGHTDSVGAVDANTKLSQARAEAVVAALTTTHRIGADRLRGYGLGPLAPVASNAAEEGRAKNRRVELVKQ